MTAFPAIRHDGGMGFLSKMTGGPDKKLLTTGLLGRGIIVDVRPTGTTMEVGNGLVQRVCVFTVEVSLDRQAPYNATCRQRIPEIQIPQIRPGNTTVAVRVSPDDPTQIALDFATEPPIVTSAGPADANHSAAAILASGAPGQAVIVQYEPLGKRNQAGVDLYAYLLTVMPMGADPYQIQVGNPTPPSALPFLFPGSRVPVKIGTNPNAVVIDWEAAAAADHR
jgi:hypothetical protein